MPLDLKTLITDTDGLQHFIIENGDEAGLVGDAVLWEEAFKQGKLKRIAIFLEWIR